MEKEQNCLTCKNRISKNYITIRCNIWTPKLKKYGYSDDESRVFYGIKCQFYTPNK